MTFKSERANAAKNSVSIRDNFARKVVDALKQRVAGICSNPTCGVQTLAPGTDPLAISNIGQAAHIHAAAPGGPRYDPSMTPEERRAITNGIWLCATCATLIDRDPESYPPGRLRQWRQDAEFKAKQGHGKKPPSEADAMETLVVAMTGRGSQFIPSAIANTHAATQQVLQELDPRFAVHTSHVNGITKIRLNAKENVPFTISIGKEHAAQWSSGIEAVVKNAKEVTLPMRGVNFSGSRLIELLTERSEISQAQLTISPLAKPAVIKLSSGISGINLDDISGRIFVGKDTIRFEGSAYADLVKLTLSVERLHDTPGSPKITFGFDLARWHGRPVAEATFLNKVFDLVRSLAEPESFRARLEVDGNVVLQATKPKVHESEHFQAVEATAHYIHRAKVLTTYLKINLNVDLTYGFSAVEHEQIADAVKIIEGRKVFGPNEFATSPEISIVTRDVGFIERMTQEVQQRVWKIEQDSRMIRVFGVDIQLPRIEILLMNSNIRIMKKIPINESPEEFKMTLQFEPTPEFRCIYRFVGQESPV